MKAQQDFKEKIKQALELIKTAGYFDFFTTYIRKIMEIDGLTQLRETEVAIWANKFAVENPVDAASLFVQKAYHMKEYLEGELYYGGNAEKRSVAKRIEFLQALKRQKQRQRREGRMRHGCCRCGKRVLWRFKRAASSTLIVVPLLTCLKISKLLVILPRMLTGL